MLNRWFPHPKGGVNQGMYLTTEGDDVITQEGSLLAEDASTLATETDVELTIEDLLFLT